MAKFLRLKMLKRFRFGGQDLITNPNPNIIRLAKITNPNPNIRDSEEKIRIRIRIRIFVTTLDVILTWKYGLQMLSTNLCALNTLLSAASVTSVNSSSLSRRSAPEKKREWWSFHFRRKSSAIFFVKYIFWFNVLSLPSCLRFPRSVYYSFCPGLLI